MDAVVRSWPLLLIELALVALVTLAACSPAKREPVGLSTGGAEDGGGRSAAANNPPLARVPSDFRTSWTKAAPRFSSEHAGLEADLYVDPASCADAVHGKAVTGTGGCRFAEELFRREASVGIYLLEHGDAGARFAVGDTRGRTVADDAVDGGAAALDACARCHSEATRAGIFAAPAPR